MTRPAGNHYHPDLWTRDAQHRYEDRTSDELEHLRSSVERLTTRVTLMMGGIGLLIFIIPIAAPLIRAMLGLP